MAAVGEKPMAVDTFARPGRDVMPRLGDLIDTRLHVPASGEWVSSGVERRLISARSGGFALSINGRDGVRGVGKLRAFLNARGPSRQLGRCVGRALWMPEVAPI